METERLIHSYGRRRGRRLREGRATLVAAALPRLSLNLPLEGQWLDPAAQFPVRPTKVWLEVGFGGGEHLVAQAATHPGVGFIGAEPYINGIAGLLAQVDSLALTNLRVWPDDVRRLLPSLPDGSLDRVFVLHPDPWPKLRHHKRRLIARPFLDALVRVMGPGAELRVATDDPGYLVWILEQLTAHPGFQWLARTADDWRLRPPDWPPTRYEEKALAEGRVCTYLRFARRTGQWSENT